jgi:hypothetical protein
VALRDLSRIASTARGKLLANACGDVSQQDKIWEHPYVRENAKSQRMLRWAKFFNYAGLILAFIGLILFIRGVYVAAHALEKLVGAR